jgi:hypothetical protein
MSLKIIFLGKNCEPFVAPLDVKLKNEDDTAPNHLQPDLMIICDKSGLKDNEYGEYDQVGFYDVKDTLDCKSFSGLNIELSHIFE